LHGSPWESPPTSKLWHTGRNISEPVVAYPRSDRQFHLYVDAATGGANSSGGFGAILGQLNSENQLQVVAYAIRSLKDHEKNYTPYLAELNAAAWAIDNFDVYLRGRKFILYTDHKPMVIKKSIHQKTLNRLEERLGMYDFQVVYKKGTLMPADVLSRKPIGNIAVNSIHGNDSYKSAAESDLFCQDVERYLLTKSLPSDPIRAKILHQIGPHVYKEQDILKLRAGNSDLIILPRTLANSAIDNAHGTLLTGHGGIDKTVARVRQLYYWPSMIVDVKQQLAECPRCQKALKSAPMGEPLHPLPLCSEPNQRIHCDLFGPLKTQDGKAHVLCITDAFTRYAELCVVDNKEAATVASAIVSNWICRFVIPDQIFSDGGKEFANKILAQICTHLQIAKNKTTPAHPQCNAQVEVVNKTIKKYLTTMTENSLDWKPLVPTLSFAYNTTLHSTTGFSPAHLMFGYQPKYSTNTTLPDSHNQATDNLLRHLFLNRQLANKNALSNSDKYKQRHDENIKDEPLAPGQFVFLDQRLFLNTNEKLEDKWEGPYVVSKVFPNGTLDLIRKGRSIRVNKARIKPFTAMGNVKTFIPDMPPNLMDHPTDHLLLDDPVFDDHMTQDPDIPNLQPPPNKRGPRTNSDQQDQILPAPDLPSSTAPPKSHKRGRPKKSDTITSDQPPAAPAIIPSSSATSDAPLPPMTNAASTPPAPVQSNARFGSHPMVLRQRLPKPTISHIKIASLSTRSNIPKVKRLNAIIIRKFAKLINSLASLPILDEYALPKQVTNQSTSKQINRRRQYLKSLCPTHRNTLLTGDPLFSFDPVVYEYVWSTSRPPLPPELLQFFEHLPDVPDLPPGELVPFIPDDESPPPRPNSAPSQYFPPLSGPEHGAIPRRPRSASPNVLRPYPMDIDPRVEYPPDNDPYPEAFWPPEFQPYHPPYIPPLPQTAAAPYLPYDPYPALQPPPSFPHLLYQNDLDISSPGPQSHPSFNNNFPPLQLYPQPALPAPPPQHQLPFHNPPALQHIPQQALPAPLPQPQLLYLPPSIPVNPQPPPPPVIRPARFNPSVQQHPTSHIPQPPQPSSANRPSRLSQIRQQLPPLTLPSVPPSTVQPASGPPSIPPFAVTTPPDPHLAPQAEAAAFPFPAVPQPDPTTPPLDDSILKRMKSALKRFPIRQYTLPSRHPQIRHPAFAPSQPSSAPRHSTPASSTVPPLRYLSSSSSSSSGTIPLRLPYYNTGPLPDTDHSMVLVPYPSQDLPNTDPLPSFDLSMALLPVPHASTTNNPDNNQLMLPYIPSPPDQMSRNASMHSHMTFGSQSSCIHSSYLNI